MKFIKRRAYQRALAATAITAVMATAASTAVAADNPTAAMAQRAEAETQQRAHGPAQLAAPRVGAPGQGATPRFSMTAVDKRTGNLYLYFPDGQGGFKARYDVGVTYDFAAFEAEVDNDKDGYGESTWHIDKQGRLSYTYHVSEFELDTKTIGGGWQIYDKVLSPGNLAGAGEADMIARDKSGVLWLYLGYSDGRVAPRIKIGGGWDAYTEIAGQGDLNGDGKADIVAADKAGVLWLYTGTGNYNAPFNSRTKIGGGWNAYDRILSVGDLNGDGRTDLVARAKNGDLYRYFGNGHGGDPFDARVKIGWGYNIYNLL
ncbi:VCBS repeat-containing protein [Streptomyces sp. NBC_00083]|uniref:FG-GAP repeat domain-containing protein n=1 Tax=Streptomyces sp. NBC_00083 TaxID=2975647 RepID=UPI0022566A77|nr:VCBS repeat-containing protein [Streptomyces sp. NBC_00083]MCX5384745.1 VCBS repeat-containing protein [Streptomyces sp. NBC_00083]